MYADNQLRIHSAYAFRDPRVCVAFPSKIDLRVRHEDRNARRAPSGAFPLDHAVLLPAALLAYVHDDPKVGMDQARAPDALLRTVVAVDGGDGENEAAVRHDGSVPVRDVGAFRNGEVGGSRCMALVLRNDLVREIQGGGMSDVGGGAYDDDAGVGDSEGEYDGRLHQRAFESRWTESTA